VHTPRRLHLTLRLDQAHQVTATFRRLWGACDDVHPVIRVVIEQPEGVNWWWIMRPLASAPQEIAVPDDWESLTAQARYALLHETVMDRYHARAGMEDRHTPHRRKQGRR